VDPAECSNLSRAFDEHRVLAAQDTATAHNGKKEEVYVIRSVRISRINPTEFCAQSQTGFADNVFKDRYVFQPVTTRAEHGAVISTVGKETALLHACFGKMTRFGSCLRVCQLKRPIRERCRVAG